MNLFDYYLYIPVLFSLICLYNCFSISRLLFSDNIYIFWLEYIIYFKILIYFITLINIVYLVFQY